MKKTSIIKETIIALLLTLVFAVSTATTAMAAENHVIRLSDKEETSSSDNRLFSKLLEKLLACKTIPGEIELDESMQVEIRKYLEETEPTKKSRSITGNDLYWELDDYTLYLNFDRELFLITPSESIFEISFGFLANADSNKPDGFVSFENVTYISNENGFSVWEFGKEKIRYQIDGLNNPQFEGWHSGVGHIYMHSGNNFGYFEPKTQTFTMVCNDYSADAKYDRFCNSLFYKNTDGHPVSVNLLTKEAEVLSDDMVTSFTGSDSIRYIDAYGNEKKIPYFIDWDGKKVTW